MRPRSMTGFGRGEAEHTGRVWTAEIRTVNHRFLDQRVVLPRSYAAFEEPVKKEVAAHLDRGRVEISLTVQGELAQAASLQINTQLADQYFACLQDLRQKYELSGSVTLQDMLNQRDLIVVKEQAPDMEQEWELIQAALVSALADCDTMREREGQELKHELLERLDLFAGIVEQIGQKIPEILHQRQEELRTRIKTLLDGLDIDPLRLAQETAVMADKSDVTEEIVRLESHIGQFRAFLESDEPVGRRLDFLLQEFLREVNTLNSKIANGKVAHLGVEMKNEVEKLREQVQNLE